jgi:3-oxoacyl-(acyl-carrier-protein) synthase
LNRVVITGLGVVSSVGQSTRDYWDSLIEGRSGFAPATLGNTPAATGKLVGEVSEPQQGIAAVFFIDTDCKRPHELAMNSSHHARRIRARARRLSAGAWDMRMH